MKADKKTEAEVMAAIESFLNAYTRRDIKAILAHMAPDPDLTLFGTGRDEKAIGIAAMREQLKSEFEQVDEMAVDLPWLSLSAAGAVAWMAADSTWRIRAGGQDVSFYRRWTLVLERRRGKWLVVQSHLSAPAGAQDAGQSSPRAA